MPKVLPACSEWYDQILVIKDIQHDENGELSYKYSTFPIDQQHEGTSGGLEEPYCIPIRNYNACLTTNYPSDKYDCTNKAYVDGLVGDIETLLGGTTDYTELSNKPKINGVELDGNKTTKDLGIKIPTKLSELTNDKGYIDNSALTDYYTKTEVDDIINELPSGGSENWELINKITTTEDTKLIEFTTDLIGNAFELKRIAYSAALKGTSANSSNGTLYVGLSKTTHELDIQSVLRSSDTSANGYAEIVGASSDTSKNLNLVIGGTSEGKAIATNGGIANSNVISYIRLYSASSNAIGAGTTVYIYGVKK